MRELKHYGVLGMRWGQRRAGGARSVVVGKGLRGKLKEIKGLTKDALLDDFNKARSIGSRAKSFISRIRKNNESSRDHVVSRTLKKKPTRKLSNDELKTVINRLQLEKQLRDLSKHTAQGKSFTHSLLDNIVGKPLNAYANSQMDPIISDYINSVRKKN